MQSEKSRANTGKRASMLTTDELDFLQAVADVIAAAVYRFVLARRREGFSVRNERPSATVARR